VTSIRYCVIRVKPDRTQFFALLERVNDPCDLSNVPDSVPLMSTAASFDGVKVPCVKRSLNLCTSNFCSAVPERLRVIGMSLAFVVEMPKIGDR